MTFMGYRGNYPSKPKADFDPSRRHVQPRVSRRTMLCGLASAFLPSSAPAQHSISTPAQLDDGWQVASLAEANLDIEAVRELISSIDAGINFPNIHAVLIEHRGRLVLEHYRPGLDWAFEEPLGVVQHGPRTRHDIRSVTKSVTSLLLGIALSGASEQTLLLPITDLLPHSEDYGDRLDQVTLHHVLTMTAGLSWNETIVPFNQRNDFIQLLTRPDPINFVVSKELRETPGDRWTYNSGLTELIAGVIENLTGDPLADFARAVFFDPLGITDYEWSLPPAWGPNSFPSASAGLRMRGRDLAKIGSLILHNGTWQGREIVPSDWIRTSVSRHVHNTPWGPPGVYGYGYFWFPGTLLSGHDVIRASGWGGQSIHVLPELGLSVTIFAGNYEDGGTEVGERIVGRLIRALN